MRPLLFRIATQEPPIDKALTYLIVIVRLTQHLYWANLTASIAIGVAVLEVFGIEGVHLCTRHNVVVEVAAIIVQRKPLGLMSNHHGTTGHLAIRIR